MYSQKGITIKHFIIFAVSLLLISCKADIDDTKNQKDDNPAEDTESPLEKIYNPKTLSQDLEAISDSNTVILKNIINAYQKMGETANRIAGNEVIMIESSTYKQLVENYNQFHSNWKETKKKELITELSSSLESLMNRSIKPLFLKENFKVWLLPEKVKDPENGYVSFKLLYENQSDKPIKFNDGLLGKIVPSNKTIDITPEGFISANSSKIDYIVAYKFSETESPNSKTQLNLILNKSSEFTYGNRKYSFNNVSLTDIEIDEAVIAEKERIIKEFIREYQNEFPRTFWPYNTDRFKKKKNKLMSKYYKAFADYLKSEGHM